MSAVVQLAQQLLSYKTITPKEEGIFAHICAFLGDFEMVRADKNGVSNVLFYKRFGDPTKTPLHFCFAGHIDVVPVSQGWQYDPFGGVVHGDFLYGRGAQDMKGGIAAFVCALRDVCATLKEDAPPLILSILLTSDEEGEAQFGTQYILEVLRERALLPTCALVAEPTSAKELGDGVKIGRRGSIGGKIVVQGIPGHVAYPRTCLNPIDLVASKLNFIAGTQLDSGNAFFEPSRLVITAIKSDSGASNVTPKSVEILFNVRHSPETTLEDVRNFLDRVLEKIPCNITLQQHSLPFLSPKDCALVRYLQEAIAKILERTPVFNTHGGTSDARFLATAGVEVVEFGLPNDRIHATDERVRVDDLNNLYKVFVELLYLIIKDAHAKQASSF
ncbi:succinyl-diaminopimelate desuccinylase [Helicobacter baculiformis]|uniref:Succinyl-diaminopimelate desuccinylase n=1 Tax=Helicobacter baculiformis TaxID=427351 RepID=A0ABV7ZJ70_9HELI|nr:succinyl-diaminopimelate desuccinylase [Helicobacter baculiformis]